MVNHNFIDRMQISDFLMLIVNGPRKIWRRLKIYPILIVEIFIQVTHDLSIRFLFVLLISQKNNCKDRKKFLNEKLIGLKRPFINSNAFERCYPYYSPGSCRIGNIPHPFVSEVQTECLLIFPIVTLESLPLDFQPFWSLISTFVNRFPDFFSSIKTNLQLAFHGTEVDMSSISFQSIHPFGVVYICVWCLYIWWCEIYVSHIYIPHIYMVVCV